ncbi:hypothetical protein BpHYR1_051036 [Brachionus plicatilis]|uniref:Uncharacterized protein n=1 Tax=Brachionus plicatilis TaxID=10195 RepID=A0A3M7SRA2_BRAPC|nr:hypothetical protein BpHYR1_051036 [Brachionus plicatilis]
MFFQKTEACPSWSYPQWKKINELDSRAVSSGLIPLFSPLIIRVFLIKNFQIRFPMVFGTCLRPRQSCFFF